jgi:uncharacterized damage-inducible protein DinB
MPTLAAAQEGARTGLAAELLADLKEVEEKTVGLAKQIPADRYAWRPGEGVRSVREVLLHVGSDNYFIPTAMGVAAPPATGITSDFASTGVYEKRDLSKEQVVSELQASFDYLEKLLEQTTDEQLAQAVQAWGREATRRRIWLLAVTHLHEHLGQLIAYARTNAIKPPWS